jgi:hypothetical protein
MILVCFDLQKKKAHSFEELGDEDLLHLSFLCALLGPSEKQIIPLLTLLGITVVPWPFQHMSILALSFLLP